MEEKLYTTKSYYEGISLLADFLRQIPNDEFVKIINTCDLEYHSCATKNKIIGVLIEKMMTPKKTGWFN
jgi:hypothetical protein